MSPAGEPTTQAEIDAWNRAHRVHPGRDSSADPRKQCDWPACFSRGTVVAVTVTPQDYGDDPNPRDAITKMWLVCEPHLKDPLIEVGRVRG